MLFRDIIFISMNYENYIRIHGCTGKGETQAGWSGNESVAAPGQGKPKQADQATSPWLHREGGRLVRIRTPDSMYL